MTLRHGAIPAGRHMFDVSAEETVALAQTHNLSLLHDVVNKSQIRAGANLRTRPKGVLRPAAPQRLLTMGQRSMSGRFSVAAAWPAARQTEVCP